MKLVHLLALIGLGAVALVGFDQYRTRMADRDHAPPAQATARVQPRAPAGDPAWGTAPAARAAPVVAVPSAAAASPFRCDGRTHCSQMTSCAEATYFLRNCPNTQMDGDKDGEPCERQWCN